MIEAGFDIALGIYLFLMAAWLVFTGLGVVLASIGSVFGVFASNPEELQAITMAQSCGCVWTYGQGWTHCAEHKS